MNIKFDSSMYGETPSDMQKVVSKPVKKGPIKTDEKRVAKNTRVRKVSRIFQFEGPRGYSTRATVMVRYFVYFLSIIVLSALTEALTHDIARAGFAGKAMFFSASFMFLVGAVGTLFYVEQRHEIIEQVRHYVFGIAGVPGLGIAAFMWASKGFLSPGSSDVFVSTVAYTLPIIFACTVIIPALVLIKTVAGMRTLHRSRMDDEEMIQTWTRQGGVR